VTLKRIRDHIEGMVTHSTEEKMTLDRFTNPSQ